jgi:hypothetical protein
MRTLQRYWMISFVVSALLFLLIACVAPISPQGALEAKKVQPQQQALYAELQRQERRWHEQKIVNYRYVLQLRCYCGAELRQPVLVKVHNATVSSLTKQSGTGMVAQRFHDFATVDQLFALIENAISSTSPRREIVVAYDPRMGYPTKISLTGHIVDAGLSIQVSDFMVEK